MQKMTQKCAVKAGLVRPDWPKIMVDCMLWVLELKLQQNRHTFGEVLKSTGSKMIVEKSQKDTFWGCIQEGDIFDGQNQLGLLLVKVRENYDRTVKERQLTHPNGFLILPEDMAAQQQRQNNNHARIMTDPAISVMVRAFQVKIKS